MISYPRLIQLDAERSVLLLSADDGITIRHGDGLSHPSISPELSRALARLAFDDVTEAVRRIGRLIERSRGATILLERTVAPSDE